MSTFTCILLTILPTCDEWTFPSLSFGWIHFHFRGRRSDFSFYFAFYYIYIGRGTARFITLETRMVPDCAGIAPVETRLLPASSRFITVFDSIPGYSRWVPAVLNILKQPGTWAGSKRFIPDLQGCPRCRHGCDTVHHGSSQIIKPGWTGTLNRDSENGALGTWVWETKQTTMHNRIIILEL